MERRDIHELISAIGEDKHTNPTTTSDQFKIDLYTFCIENDVKYSVELGTHKGQTSRILSFCCNEVHTINISENSLIEAKKLNSDRSNIIYYAYDLYANAVNLHKLPIGIDYDRIDLMLIDAGHGYANVIDDVYKVNIVSKGIYLCFDDYGLIEDVNRAVNDLISIRYMTPISNIGMPMGYDFKNGRILKYASEGIICKKL